MKKKAFAILVSFAMIISMLPTVAFSLEFTDMPDDWSTTALENAVNNGLLIGYDGKIMPKDNLTRAQMAAAINRAFGATEKASLISYTDVAVNAWYFDDMAKAVQMQTFVSNGDKLNPEMSITREEAFLVLARAFKLSGATERSLDVFSDKAFVSQWAKDGVASLVSAGYVIGSNGQLNPKQDITRAEFAQILDNLLKQYIKKAGDVTEVVNGNIMVNTPGVTLKNLLVNGDLIIGDGVGDGEVVLDSVEVTGRLVIRGGGVNSIIIKGNSDVSSVVIARIDGKVSVKVQGDANVEVIYIDDGSNDVNVEGTVGNIQVEATDIVVTVVAATINSVEVFGENSRVIVDTNSTVVTVSIEKNANKAKVEVLGTVATVTTTAEGTSVTGTGTVTTVEAQSGATGASIETPNTQISVEAGVSGVTGGGGEAIQSGSTATNNASGTDVVASTAPSTDDGDDSDDDGLPTAEVTNVSVANSETVVVTMSELTGATFAWNGSAVTGTYADDKYTVTVPTIKAVANRLIVSATDYASATKDIAIEDGTYGNLTVVSDSAELKAAIAAQADDQVWILKSAVYDVTGHVDAAPGITECTGSKMIIRGNKITIQGIGTPTIIADSDAGFVLSDDGTLTGQQAIYILGDGVSIDGIKIVPTNDENITICIEGDDIALSNIITEPRSGSTVGGVIYFNNAGKTASLSNAVLNFGRISFWGATGATITLSDVEVKFSGSSQEGEGPYYAYYNPSLATVTATDLIVTMSAAIGRGLQTAVGMLPSGATVILDAGTYYIAAALTKPTGVTVDTDTNDATIVIAQNIVNAVYSGTDTEAIGGIKRYSTIQAAVSGATAGDILFVAAGTYTEIGEIEITKALTIKGQNYWDGDTYHESTFVSVTPVTGLTHCDTIFWVHDCADVYISGFTLDRAAEIGGVETPTSETGVVFTGGCDFNGSIVSDCKVIDERVVPDDNCFSALEVIQADNVIFENNIVEGVVNENEFAAEEFYDGGIGELGGCEGIVIRGNHIDGLGTAVSPRGGSGISCVMAGAVTIEDNEITGCRYGIYENQVDIAISNNDIYSNDIGVQCGWTLDLHNNSIYDNPVSISCGFTAGEKVDVTGNYWGDTDYASIAETFDGNAAFFPWAMDRTQDGGGNYVNLCPIVVNGDWSAYTQNTAPIPTLTEGAANYPELARVQADIDGDGTDEIYNIGINAFGTLEEAIAKANAGDTIVLENSISLFADDTLKAGVTLIVQVGKTLTIASGATFTIEDGATIIGTIAGEGNWTGKIPD